MPTLKDLLPQYLDSLRIQHQSPLTVQGSHQNLLLFVGWCECRDIAEATSITHATLERYQRHLWYYRKPKKVKRSVRNTSETEDASDGKSAGDGDPLSIRTQSTRLVHMRSFFAWLTKAGHIPANPAADIQLPKLPRSLPKDILNHAETECILAVPDVDTPCGLRNRAMLELLYSTGMRRMEVMKMGIFDMDPVRGVIHVKEGKGRKDRIIPVSKRAVEWVDRYMREARPTLYSGVVFGAKGAHPKRKYRVDAPMLPQGARSQDVMFLTQYGDPFRLESLGSLVSAIMKEAGIVGKKVSCHSLRHAVAVGLLENNADIRFIQQLLGHENLETTAIYTKVCIEKLKDVVNKCHPANQGKQAAG